MLRDLRETALQSAHGQLIFPRYDGFSFANIPDTVLALFGVDSGRPLLDEVVLEPMKPWKFEHVLVVLIDGLGFNQWTDRAVKHPFFRRLGESGSVTSLTAVFPSTTAAALTSFSTGLTPQEHGLPEWTVYLREIDEIITTLPFKRWNSKQRDELLTLGIDASVLFDGKTIFEQLAEKGVPSVAFTQQLYSQGAYSQVSKRGSRTVSYLGASDLVVRIADELEAARRPTLFYVYWDDVDTLGHVYSPYSRETGVEIDNLSHMFVNQLPGLLGPAGKRAAERTLLFVTADHGQMQVVPEKTIYLTDHMEVVQALQSKRNGEPILPTGSMRDVFLHLRPGKIEETVEFLSRALAGKAEVWLTQDAFQKGLFGLGAPKQKFAERVGNVLILPYPGETVWAAYPGSTRPHTMRGHHGGLSSEEMFIPLAAALLASVLEP